MNRREALSILVGALIAPSQAFADISKVEMFGLPCKPKVKAAAPQTRSTVTSYSMVFNVEGDWHPSDQKIARHILSVHGINPAGMSRAEMLIAHDRAHGVKRARSNDPIQHARPVRMNYRASSRCPDGRCPIN